MPYNKIIAVRSDVRQNHINASCGKNVEFLSFLLPFFFLSFFLSQSNLFYLLIVDVEHGCSNRGPPCCIIRPAATFVNCVYTIKIS